MSDEERRAIVDAEHVRVLAICYAVSAGIHAVFSLFGLFYALMGVFFMRAFEHLPPQDGQPPPEIGWFFGLFGLAIFTIMIIAGALQLLVAIRLRQHRSRLLSMAIAALSCLEIPYGTALGVFTFIVLSRRSVALAFDTQ